MGIRTVKFLKSELKAAEELANTHYKICPICQSPGVYGEDCNEYDLRIKDCEIIDEEIKEKRELFQQELKDRKLC